MGTGYASRARSGVSAPIWDERYEYRECLCGWTGETETTYWSAHSTTWGCPECDESRSD